MIKRKKYLLKDHPEMKQDKYNGREEHHPPAKEFMQITAENRRLIMKAFDEVLNRIVEFKRSEDAVPIKVYAYGSRVNGRWSEQSDIDLMISGQFPPDTFKDIVVDGLKVDVKPFNLHIIPSILIAYEQE